MIPSVAGHDAEQLAHVRRALEDTDGTVLRFSPRMRQEWRALTARLAVDLFRRGVRVIRETSGRAPQE